MESTISIGGCLMSVPKDLINSLEKVYQYLHDDECKHFEESGQPVDHIYHDVIELDNLVNLLKGESNE
mgnify:CR=1 FL=1